MEAEVKDQVPADGAEAGAASTEPHGGRAGGESRDQSPGTGDTDRAAAGAASNGGRSMSPGLADGQGNQASPGLGQQWEVGACDGKGGQGSDDGQYGTARNRPCGMYWACSRH